MTTEKLLKEKSSSNQKIRLPWGFLGKIVLGTVAVAGIVSVAVVAPGIVQAVRLLEKQHARDYRRYRSLACVRKEVERLRRKNMITVFERHGETVIRLTERGKRELLRYQLREKKLERRRWDGKWRLIIFDIQEKRRLARDRIREEMQSFGFKKLQESVWVYPYECEQIVTLLKADNKIGQELLYIIASDVENNAWLKKKFNLK